MWPTDSHYEAIDLRLFIQLTVVSVVIYAVGCMAVKSTLLFLYLRIFSPHPRARLMIYSGLSFIIVFYTISIIVALASCLPRAGDGGWSSTARGERCQSEDTRFAEVQGVIGALTDLYVLLVPMTMIADLHLSRKRKFGVYGVFFTGFMAFVVSIVNAAFRFEMFKTGDALWNEVPIYALCAAELNIGIMCACMPVVYVLFKDAAVGTLSWASSLRSWASRSKTAVEMNPYDDVEKMSLPKGPGEATNSLDPFKPVLRNWNATNFMARPPPVPQREVRTHVSAQYDYHSHIHQPERLDGMSSFKTWQLSTTYSPAESNGALYNA